MKQDKPKPDAIDLAINDGAVVVGGLLRSKLPWLCGILTVASFLSASISDPSIFAHLAIGRSILRNAALPWFEPWSSLAISTPWQSASWLFDIAAFQIYRAFGFSGIVAIEFLLIALFVIGASLLFSLAAADRFYGTLTAVIVSAALFESPHFSPELLGYTFFISILGFVLSMSAGFDNGREKKKTVFKIFVLAVLVANLHFHLLLALPIFLLLLAFGSQNKGKNVLLFVLLFVVAALVTPYYGANIWQTALNSLTVSSLKFTYRIEPATIYNYQTGALILLWVSSVLFMLSVKGSALNRQNRGLIVVAGAVSLAALGAQSFLATALILTGMMCAVLAKSARENEPSEFIIGLEKLKGLFASFVKLSPIGVIWVLLCLVIVNLASVIQTPVLWPAFPVREVDYLLEKSPVGPIFHEPGVGSYLAFRFSENSEDLPIRPLWDSRVGEVKPELIVASYRMEKLLPGWRDFLDSVNPNFALVRTTSVLFSALSKNPKWRIAFKNGKEVLPGEIAVNNEPYGWAILQTTH